MISSQATNEICPVCGSTSNQFWSARDWPFPSSEDHFRLGLCSNCESVFAIPRPTEVQLAAFYKYHYTFEWFEKHLLLKNIQGWHRWHYFQSLLEKHAVRKGRLLDIGCGHGLFLHWAARAGWQAVGLDHPSQATAYAREKYGLEIIESDLLGAIGREADSLGKFDLITTWHCLEHTADPRTFLAAAKTLLKPGGKMLIVVPNASSPGMQIKREEWVWCQEPFVHTVHFTPGSLGLLVKECGLSLLDTSSRETWDANLSFDLAQSRTFKRLHFYISGLSDPVGFWFYEGCRVLGYLKGRLSPPEEGAELAVFAERNGP